MKFLCLECDEVMKFSERALPGDGTLTVIFTCGTPLGTIGSTNLIQRWDLGA